MSKLYAKKGERVTCENGHAICLVARNIPWGGLHSPDYFTDWLQPEPLLATLASKAPCKRCGARWFGGEHGTDGMRLHFADGWR